MMSDLGMTFDSKHFLRKTAQAHAHSFFVRFLPTKRVSFLCCCCDALSSDVSLVLSDGYMPGVGWCVVQGCFIRLLLVLSVTGITWMMYRSQNTPWALTKVRIPQEFFRVL